MAELEKIVLRLARRAVKGVDCALFLDVLRPEMEDLVVFPLSIGC